MTSAPYMEYYQYLDDRDLILFVQRGNYDVQPHLDCPEWADAVYQSNLPGGDDAQGSPILKVAATKCRDRLIKQGIDLNGYRTNEIAADIHDLITVFEIEQYNLLTLSYSTKIAQVFIRDYPERIRSVVMDSPLPLEVNDDDESVENLLASIELLLSDCEKDPDCNTSFPNLKQRFSEYFIEKTNNPLMKPVWG